MSFWKAGIGGMIGFTLGGPIGGIIGAIIGSKLSDNQPRPSNNQQNQAAFFTALFACFAKIAKADGIVTREEVDKVDLFILAEKEIKRIENSHENLNKYKTLLKLYDQADVINDLA